jgi:hypothetical protein
MATVRISYNAGNVPIVTGDLPPNPQTPIASPTPTGFTTNRAFIVPEGIYCYGLDTATTHTPLWQVVQAVDGEQTDIAFQSVP